LNVLLIGFTPFADVRMNPSQIIVDEVARRYRLGHDVTVCGQTLDTVYESAGVEVCKLIVAQRPNIIALFGVAPERDDITVERFALNIDDCPEPDNAGDIRSGTAVLKEGPIAYRSTLPVDALCRHLQANGLPAHPSNHAGTYVCNHVFYLARNQADALGLSAMCGFIHVPMPVTVPGLTGADFRFTIYDLVRAGELCVDYLISVLSA
jgi:pyroglutamyl-peptidase